jgi:hypothetical protein
VSQAHQVVPGTRASHRQRRETRQRIIQARREGRISQDVCDARLQSASQAVTTAELKHLESDLGQREGTQPQHIMWVACCLPAIIAAWEPVFLSGLAWLALAVPVTFGVPVLAWVLPGLLA